MTWENRLKFYVSSADPDSASPVWVDLSSRVMDNVQPLDQTNGRTNVLDDITTPGQPGQLTLVLDNRDGALTYGNTTSPYASWWGPGRKCLLTETISGAAQNRFTGYLQMPTEAVITDGMESRVAISAIDRLGRLSQGRPFVSTLGAHILASAPSANLYAYWKLGSTVDVGPVTGPSTAVFAPAPGTFGGGSLNPPVTGAFVADAPSGVYGDDSGAVLFTPNLTGFAYVQLAAPISLTVTSTQTVTVAAWIKPTPKSALSVGGAPFVLANSTSGSDLFINNLLPPNAGEGAFNLPAAVTGSVFTTLPFAPDTWRLVTVSVNLATGVLTLWSGSDQTASTTIGGAPFTGDTFNVMAIAQNFWEGAIAHLQIYVGTGTPFSLSDHLAQFQVGMYGLEAQTTGARVDSILAYAGVPTADYTTTTDTGTSIMQVARLAGKDPLTALREAETTEQGLLYVDGSGAIHFADRRTLYGI